MGLRVVVAGAGIGGLTLAHALRRRGISCVVHERDAGPGDTAGYRLHLSAEAFAVLRGVLPGPAVRALRECGAGNDTFRQFAVLDHRGRTRLRLPVSHPGEVLMIGRRPLRRILARGVDVRWGSVVRGFEVAGGGVRLGDGTEADLLVAADGTGSRLARRWAGGPVARPAGVTGIAGRADLPQRLPAELRHGLAFALGPHGVGAFLSLQATRGRDPAAEPPSVVWSVAAATGRLALDPSAASPPALLAEAHRLTRGWSDGFHDLFDRTAAAGVAAFPFWLPAALQPWPAGPVTLLGDAVHPMPPTAGAGASTAILDAGHLAADLDTLPLPAALAAYQHRLLAYAPAAVAESRPPLLWQRRLANPLAHAAVTGLVLPVASAALRLRGLLTR